MPGSRQRGSRRRGGSFGVLSRGNYAGTDQGVDFSGSGPIPALGPAIVTDVGVTTGDIQGARDFYVIYKLTAGPYKGRHVYVAENFEPSVKKGQRIRLGESIGQAPGNYPYIEIGFNKSPTGWNPVASLYPNPHGAKQAGAEMWQYIQGVIGMGPRVTGDTGGINPKAPVLASQHERLPRSEGGGIGFAQFPADLTGNGVGGEAAGGFGAQTSFDQEGAFGLAPVQAFSPVQVANVWQQLANDQVASPMTRQLAANAGQVVGTTPSLLTG